jgi:hypothetical protein
MSIEGLPGEISVTLDLDLAPSVEEEDAAQGDSLIAHTGLTSSSGPPLHLHGCQLLTELEYRISSSHVNSTITMTRTLSLPR